MELEIRGSKLVKLQFREKMLRISTAGLFRTAPGESVCGDSNLLVKKDAQYMLCISDGMGNGQAAAQESRATVALMEKFFKAGYCRQTMLKTVNSLLMMRGEEVYSTVDMCVVDMSKGEAEFIKVGAAPSFLVRGNEVIRIMAPSLPMGIVEDMEPASIRKKILPKDRIIMLSDGISDIAGENLESWVIEAKGDAQEIAAMLMHRAVQCRGATDDMTALVAVME